MGLEKIWYYSEDGLDRKGPITESELRRALSHGRISEQMLLWCEGMETWVQARKLPQLFQVAGVAPAVIYASPPRTSGLAITSLILGLVGFFIGWCCCVGVLLCLLGIIFGHVAQAQISRQPQLWTGKGMAIAGYVLGYVGLALYLVILLIYGVAMFLPPLAAMVR